ncbi:AAA family ATPase [Luteipulveratus halotolerans]|uniref:ATPase AAA n=1 Tax=Luteipulveratus halotolerans TaxID=1631356 RepID=A0A0L6CF71_9MICO|nr:AAA family ATPase [Luteipulveratus halotolerans]KNX36168.1 ATPase AAA [Luteipulveratus halotolerans]
MTFTDPLVQSLTRAVEAAPADVPLRLHLAEVLIQRGAPGEAVAHCAVALQHEPASEHAQALMRQALGGSTPAAPEPPHDPVAGPTGVRAPLPQQPTSPAQPPEFDWEQAESQVQDVAPAKRYADGDDDAPPVDAWDVERSDVTLDDVGGMDEVKARLRAAFLEPLRNPELRRLYGKSLRGGMLLYGPPGCGKTFLGRAVAGELGAQFVNIGLADVLDMYIGRSERNIQDVFRLARAHAPVVVFIDEVDALGQKRSAHGSSAMRTTVNQLLTELDGVESSNEGVFVIGATNQPWDIDPALRRPGRLDRTLLVVPPDESARASIFRYHLRARPVEGIDLGELARRTPDFSGADIQHVCETASEKALMASVQSGSPRMIQMGDLAAAIGEIRPSTRAWFESARNVVQFANQDGTYDELRAYMKKHRL